MVSKRGIAVLPLVSIVGIALLMYATNLSLRSTLIKKQITRAMEHQVAFYAGEITALANAAQNFSYELAGCMMDSNLAATSLTTLSNTAFPNIDRSKFRYSIQDHRNGPIAYCGQANLSTTSNRKVCIALPQIFGTGATQSGFYGGSRATNLNLDHVGCSGWNSGGFSPQWFEIDLGTVKRISKARMRSACRGSVNGCFPTADQTRSDNVYVGTTTNPSTQVVSQTGLTNNGWWVKPFVFSSVQTGRFIRVRTTTQHDVGNSWVCACTFNVYGF